MGNATAQMPTTVASKTEVGGAAFEREIRETVACVMIRFPTKVIEAAGDLTDEGVRLLKNQKRTLSVPTLLKLAKASGELGPAMWAAICKLCDRPNGNPEMESPEMNAVYGALHMLARSKGPAGEFANALLKQMNTEAVILEPSELDELREKRAEKERIKRLNAPLRDLFADRRRG